MLIYKGCVNAKEMLPGVRCKSVESWAKTPLWDSDAGWTLKSKNRSIEWMSCMLLLRRGHIGEGAEVNIDTYPKHPRQMVMLQSPTAHLYRSADSGSLAGQNEHWLGIFSCSTSLLTYWNFNTGHKEESRTNILPVVAGSVPNPFHVRVT